MRGGKLNVERFIGTTGRPTAAETPDLLKVAEPCCVCGCWQRLEWLDSERMCESCREIEEDEQ